MPTAPTRRRKAEPVARAVGVVEDADLKHVVHVVRSPRRLRYQVNDRQSRWTLTLTGFQQPSLHPSILQPTRLEVDFRSASPGTTLCMKVRCMKLRRGHDASGSR